MNELERHLALNRGVPVDDFVEATRRALARVGQGARMNDETCDEIARELYGLALEKPEGEVFA